MVRCLILIKQSIGKGREFLQYEYERAAYIHAFIRTKQAMLKDQLEGVSGDEMELKETFWENVTMNFSNSEDAQETISSIRQQAELLNERERSGELMKKTNEDAETVSSFTLFWTD